MRLCTLLVTTVALAVGCGQASAGRDEGGEPFATAAPTAGGSSGGGEAAGASPDGKGPAPAPATTDTELRARAIVADDYGAYVASEKGELLRFDPSGQRGPVTLARGVRAPIALGAGHVYATAQNDSGLVRVPRTGGVPSLVAPRVRPLAIVVAGERAIVLEGGAGGCRLLAFSSGGEEFELATPAACAAQLVADAEFVYYIHERALARVPIKGGARAIVAYDVADPEDLLAGDAGAIYVARAAGVVAIAKADGKVTRVGEAGGQPMSLAVGARVAWLSREAPDATTAALRVASKGGGAARTVLEGIPAPSGLAISATTAFVTSLAAPVTRVPLPE